MHDHGRRFGRVLAVSEDAFVVSEHGAHAGTLHHLPRVAADPSISTGDLVQFHPRGEPGRAAAGRAEGAGGELTASLIERVARGPGQWPPDKGQPGADLARFDGTRWERLRRRAALVRATRAWFEQQGFLEVETPILVPSAGTETHLDPVAVTLHPEPGAGPETRWLITSPEYAMKRLLAGGAGPIWQLTKVFRDGERGRNHRPEFSILEWYRPFVAGYEVLMADCESLVRALNGGDRLRWRGADYDLSPPWPRLRFFDLLRERADIAHPEDLDVEQWLAALVDRVEPTLGAERPEFLIEWPAAMASLARRKASDPRVAERFELYLGRLELANAFAELTDATEQRARCLAENDERRRANKPEMPIDEDFLGALEAGLPPSAGIAVGFDRLVMVLSDAATIDDVLAF